MWGCDQLTEHHLSCTFATHTCQSVLRWIFKVTALTDHWVTFPQWGARLLMQRATWSWWQGRQKQSYTGGERGGRERKHLHAHKDEREHYSSDEWQVRYDGACEDAEKEAFHVSSLTYLTTLFLNLTLHCWVSPVNPTVTEYQSLDTHQISLSCGRMFPLINVDSPWIKHDYKAALQWSCNKWTQQCKGMIKKNENTKSG